MPTFRPLPLFVLLAAPFAWAQDSAPVPDATELDTMQVTAGRLQEAAAIVPQPVTVVTPEDLRRIAPRTIADLLRGQTGLYLQASGPGQGVVIVRGLKGSEVLHLVDGMRLNNTFFRNSPNQYLALVDPFNVQQVEVLRGPGATLYGSDAMGGVVQFLTPEHRFATTDWGARGGVLAQLGSADLSKVGRAWAAAGTDALSIAGGVTAMQGGGIDTGGGPRLPEGQTGYLTRGYDGKALWSPAAGHELMLAAQFFEYPRLPRFHEIAVQPNSGGVASQDEAFFAPNDRLLVHARYRLGASFGFAESLELHAAQQIVNDDRERVPAGGPRREFEENRSTLSGVTAQAVSSAGAVRLIWGGEFYSDEVDSAKRCEPLAGTCSATATVPTFPDGAQQDSVGMYVNSEWRPLEPWLLEAGVRWSDVRTDLPATPLSPAATVSDDDVTGHLGSAVTLSEALVWTANLSRGFRAPNIFDLGTLGPRSGSVPLQINVPNPGLRPETLHGVDTGLRWNDGGLSSELVVFYSRYENRIEPREPTGALIASGTFGCTEPPPGCAEVRSENIGEADYWGVETGVRWDLSPALELQTALNLTRGNERRAGAPETPANRVPPVNGRVGVRWTVDPAVGIEPYVLFAGEQRRLDADDQADVRIAPGGTPGWATLNLRVGWQPWPAFRLMLEGTNLLDQAYREHGSGIDGYGAGAVLTGEIRL